jgi:hypothetical protein
MTGLMTVGLWCLSNTARAERVQHAVRSKTIGTGYVDPHMIEVFIGVTL